MVLGTFLSSFVTLGTAYSFGAFFTAMADEFDSGKAATSVVFGVTTFAFFWLSILTGRLADRVGPRPVLFLGACSLFFGLLLTSRAESLPVAYATYGIGVGVAAATGYIPMVAAVGGWLGELLPHLHGVVAGRAVDAAGREVPELLALLAVGFLHHDPAAGQGHGLAADDRGGASSWPT